MYLNPNGVVIPMPNELRKSQQVRMNRPSIGFFLNRRTRQFRLILRRVVKSQVFYWLVIALVLANTICVAVGSANFTIPLL